ncbi:glucose dehydrogenase [FAD, quinone] [Fopius arisanus]|uniref:Gld_23 protein n=1 Tax=Fopius arisanus TaxID=64838 RepID=A0A0C9RN05_9HYME|nr:PREDICTED: glucose dehydrogenase [FAD, quinone]-like [Fopius arisanus]XP_011315287.1 PREDICTED: glucose dehydrogenase [FAD, quinone]-like [Fopius arisanus]
MGMRPGAIIFLLLLIKLSAGTLNLDLLASYGLWDSWHIRTVPVPQAKYDFIIVGAGSGGSTLANRLSENPNWRILLLEAGKPEGIFNQVPLIVSFFQHTDYNWGYKLEPQDNACLGMENRVCPWPRGKALGGSSTINYMIHTRGNRLDYDHWAHLGNYGWSYEDVLPYFKKSEKLRISDSYNASYHGTTGKLSVEHAPYHTPISRAFLETGRLMGYNILDYNGPEQVGFSYLQLNMDRGARCSASKAYLSFNPSNLDIITEAMVTKVLIDSKNRAYGVKVAIKNMNYKILAAKEVILSAGTIDSAKLLMLSGIGPREHLEELGINVLKDAKVGYNMYEHVGFLGLTFLVNDSVSLTANTIFQLEEMWRYAIDRSGPISIPGGAEALAFLHTKYSTDSRPDLELLFVGGSLNSDGDVAIRKGLGISDNLYNAVYKPIENVNTWSIWPIVQRPRSHGRIKLRCADPSVPPILDANLLDDPYDIEIILEGIKKGMEISQAEPFQRYNSRIHDIPIPGCSGFMFASDDYWRCAIRHLPSLMDHQIGTVKMGPASDPSAVVDPELRVYGVDGLRVVDASIMPTMPVGHINAGIYMIGEKAADMIKRTWTTPKSHRCF